jgi:hypothetical protein
MPINVRSVLVGGLASGLTINISALAMISVVGPEMDGVLAVRGLPPLGGAAMAFFCAVSLTLGILLAWLYAAATAQLGPGKRTAALVSTMVWFLAYFLANASMVAYGFMPMRLTVIGTAWGLVELLLGGFVGASLYREKGPLTDAPRSWDHDRARSAL